MREILGGIIVLKKISLGLITGFLLLSGSAWAATPTWEYVREEAGSKIYLDTSSIMKKGSVLTMREKQDVTTGNAKSKIVYKQFDTDKEQWRTTEVEVLNAQGRKLAAQKKNGKWEQITKDSQAASDIALCNNYGQLKGPWSYAKNIGDTAAKYFNPATLKKGKQDSLEVWEKLDLKKETGGVKVILSHVRYFVKTGKASTLYNCEFDSKGHLVKAGPAVDEWGLDSDTYGEYLGNDLAKYLGVKHK